MWEPVGGLDAKAVYSFPELLYQVTTSWFGSKQQRLILSQLRRSEVHTPGVGRVGCFWSLRGINQFSISFPASVAPSDPLHPMTHSCVSTVWFCLHGASLHLFSDHTSHWTWAHPNPVWPHLHSANVDPMGKCYILGFQVDLNFGGCYSICYRKLRQNSG